MKKNEKSANASAKKNGEKNVNVRQNVQSKQNKETATEKAARLGAKELEKAQKAQAKADAKSACTYNMYGIFADYSKTQKYGACKLFYTSLQNACGGAMLRVLSQIIGEDKRDFAERYADKVEAKKNARGYAKYSAFVVWLALWDDLRTYTLGQAKADANVLKAVEELRAAVEARKNA